MGLYLARFLTGLVAAGSLAAFGLDPPFLKFSEPQNVTPEEAQVFNAVVSRQVAQVRSGDELLVAFAGFMGRETAIFFTRYNLSDGQWARPIRVSTKADHLQLSPTLWVDPRGSVHCAWLGRAEKQAQYQVWYSRLEERAEEWTPPLSFEAGSQDAPPLFGGDGERIYLYYWNRPEGGGWGRIFLYASEDGGRNWRPSDPNFPDGEKTAEASSPHLAAGSPGELLLTWIDRSPGSPTIVYNRSQDGGKSWLERPLRLNSRQEYVLFENALSGGEAGLQIVWVVRSYAGEERGNLEIWADSSRDLGRTWDGNRLLYSAPVNEITVAPYLSGEEWGVVWIERDSKGLWRIRNRSGASPSGNDDIVATARDEAKFAGLEVLTGQDQLLIVSSEQGYARGSSIKAFFRTSGPARWQEISLPAPETRGVVGGPLTLFIAPGRYSLLYHHARRVRLGLEAAVWESDLYFAELKRSE